MTDKEVLQKAIWKAIQNGMDLGKPVSTSMSGDTIQDSDSITHDFKVPTSLSTIFSHEFAKSFWGIEYTTVGGCDPIDGGKFEIFKHPSEKQKWKYHLQQMVLESNPIDYLRKFIN